ncbi:MAG: cupredoxin domain-containing protein [bacterium]|nr:cupredoxin domain-containing protein [bacterium]
MIFSPKQAGFIQIPILVAIFVGFLVIGGGGYVGIKQYQNSQEKKEQDAQELKLVLEQVQAEIAELKQDAATTAEKQSQTSQKEVVAKEGVPLAISVVRKATVRIRKNSWSFEPDTINVNLGDTLRLQFVNEDDYDHGLGIDAYGISQRIPARTTVNIPPFVVTRAGDFQFYCSVSCGEGVVENVQYKGMTRSHFDLTGTICVHETPNDRTCMNSDE